MNPLKNTASLSGITLAILSYSQFIYAEETDVNSVLNEIKVIASQDEMPISDRKIGQTIKSAKQLKRQQVQDNRDLVRYETGISVIEKGRGGTSGYAVRGVDENRVAIVIDGLQQAETLSSQGFKELFEGYGNFNNIRNSVEIETLKQATIQKGADSLQTGNGALGGSVIFETKDARDFLTKKNYYLSYKRGYNSADNQHLNTLTFAGNYKWFDGIAILTKRQGHELENFDYKYAKDIQGKTREKSDPYNRKLESALIKLALSPNENHRFTAIADIYNSSSKGHDFSYTLKPNTEYRTYDELELRHTNDSVKRRNYAITYENYVSNPLYDTMKITVSNQNIHTKAQIEDYCDGNEKCPNSQNSFGMHYNSNNQLLGLDNQPVSYINQIAKTNPGKAVSIEVPVEPYQPGINKKYRWQRAKWDEIDTTKYEISSKSCDNEPRSWETLDTGDTTPCITYKDDDFSDIYEKGSSTPAIHNFRINGKMYDLLGEDQQLIGDNQILRAYTSHILSCNAINCNNPTIQGFNQDGTTTEIPFTVIERNGQRFAKTEAQQQDSSGKYFTVLTAPIIFVPNKPGYQSNEWTKRDLKTTTKQINLDFSKFLQIANTEHNFTYGGLWSKTEKSMTNISGSSAINVKWWATYPTNCSQNIQNPERYSSLCNNSNTYSFLIPIKTKTSAIYFTDNFLINNKWSFNIGYRYDHIKHKPEYIPGKTPKIPDDLVNNLYETEPQFDPNNLTNNENQAKRTENANNNIKHIAQPKKYSAHSYAFGINFDPYNWLRLQAKYSKGFRAPTGEEIYFTFKHPDISILPNKDLNAEIAKTKELTATLHSQIGFIRTSIFRTDYRNFIDLAFMGPKQLHGHSILRPFNIYQNINHNKAKVTGIELESKLFVGEFIEQLQGLNLSYQLTYQKGKMDHGIPMNAIQPQKSVYGIGYDHTSGKFGIDLYITHVNAKKSKHTYNRFYKEEGKTDSTVKWRSNAYTLIDIITYIKPIENLTLQLGVYNLTDKKYITWEAARSIRPFGTSNLINQETGKGINRFYSPERNFKLSAELTF